MGICPGKNSQSVLAYTDGHCNLVPMLAYSDHGWAISAFSRPRSLISGALSFLPKQGEKRSFEGQIRGVFQLT